LLSARHPFIAWTLTLSSLSALAWIFRDQGALGRTTIRVRDGRIEGEIGRRVTFSAEASAVSSVERPRLMPVSGPPKGYVNATKPAAPNVLIVFRAPVPATVLGLSRQIEQLALRLDEPEKFIASAAANLR
jgi:hypothetical protein